MFLPTGHGLFKKRKKEMSITPIAIMVEQLKMRGLLIESVSTGKVMKSKLQIGVKHLPDWLMVGESLSSTDLKPHKSWLFKKPNGQMFVGSLL